MKQSNSLFDKYFLSVFSQNISVRMQISRENYTPVALSKILRNKVKQIYREFRGKEKK